MEKTGKHERENGPNVKKRILAIAAAAMCCALLAGGTLAYFTAEERAHNVITSGGVDIDLLEWADVECTEPFPEGGVFGVMPGTSVTKVVKVENVGQAAAWVRVEVGTEAAFASASQGAGSPVCQDDILIDFNEDFWMEGSDGCWYYRFELEPGDVTEPLFTQVAFNAGMGNAYQNCTVTVSVSAQAVQSANNPIGDSALGVPSVKGWPEESEVR